MEKQKIVIASSVEELERKISAIPRFYWKNYVLRCAKRFELNQFGRIRVKHVPGQRPVVEVFYPLKRTIIFIGVIVGGIGLITFCFSVVTKI